MRSDWRKIDAQRREIIRAAIEDATGVEIGDVEVDRAIALMQASGWYLVPPGFSPSTWRRHLMHKHRESLEHIGQEVT